ncbi:TonB-dependent receptor plug domain-containing protein [Desulforegula conservatrix]|uniref:TonB-dependent receptor plug domain-containing protein n=1 Tax=Desulforegula conservatrix TaxID=153026 RepID=UPI0018DD72CB|nr:TonB-dependent receptor [Desulforegula conservatrix]
MMDSQKVRKGLQRHTGLDLVSSIFKHFWITACAGMTEIGLIFVFILFASSICISAEKDSSIDEKCEGKGKVTFMGERDPNKRYDQKETFKTGDVDLKKTSSTCLVIDRADMEGKAQTLGEALDKEAGIQIRNSGGTGSFASISLRGSESSQVMVFMDGVPLSSASETGVDLGSIPLGDVESVEIFKGTTPMNFGMASMGGAVNIKTLRSKPGMAGFLSAGAGSYGTKALTGYFNHKPGAWDYLFSFDSLSSDNDYEIDNDNGTPYNPYDDKEEKRKNAQIRQDSFLAKTGCDIGKSGRIDFQDQYFAKNQGVPSYASYNNSENDAWLDTMRNIFSTSYTANDFTPLLLSTRTRFSHTMKREEYDDLSNSIGLGVQHSKYDTDSIEAGFYAEWKNMFNTVEFMTEARSETFKSKDLVAGRTAQDADRNTFVTGIQDRILIDPVGRLSATPGIRYSFTSDDGKSYETDDYESGFSSEDRYYFSPQFGLLYTLNDSITMKSNIAKYYREPSFFELFGDRGFFEGNERLVPERGINFDAGAEFRQKCLHEYVQEIFFGATYFHDRIYDLITRTYDARGVGVSVNVPGALITGVEGLAGIRFFGRTGLYFSAVLQNPDNLTSGLKGNQLPGRFSSKFTVRAETGTDIGLNKFLTYAEYIGENDMYYDTPNLLSAEDRRFVNIGAEYGIGDFTTCFDIKDITDGRYSDYRLYPSPGRSFLFTVKYKFSKDIIEDSIANNKERK